MNHPHPTVVAAAYRAYIEEVAAMQSEDFPTDEAIRFEVSIDLVRALAELGQIRPCPDDELSAGDRAVMRVFGGVDYCQALLKWHAEGQDPQSVPPIPDAALSDSAVTA